MDDEKLTPIEEALVRALTKAIVKELTRDAENLSILRQLDALAKRDEHEDPLARISTLARKRAKKTKRRKGKK